LSARLIRASFLVRESEKAASAAAFHALNGRKVYFAMAAAAGLAGASRSFTSVAPLPIRLRR
jgi:hypothetical protein